MRPPSNEPPVFGVDITNLQNNPAYMMCQRLAGRGIVRVVGRCKDAQENNNLGIMTSLHPLQICTETCVARHPEGQLGDREPVIVRKVYLCSGAFSVLERLDGFHPRASPCQTLVFTEVKRPNGTLSHEFDILPFPTKELPSKFLKGSSFLIVPKSFLNKDGKKQVLPDHPTGFPEGQINTGTRAISTREPEFVLREHSLHSNIK